MRPGNGDDPTPVAGATAATGATEAIARFAVRRRPEASPRAEAVTRVLLDTVAVAVAGVGSDVGAVLLDWVREEGASGPARAWGTDLSLSPSRAALVNGTTAHALDWDDAVPSMPMHPGAVLVPALLAQLATTPASGADLVHAYDVGSAVQRAVSEALPIDVHYGRGWHNTSTSGRIAATAALASLVGLDQEQTCHALGIVSSSVAGSLDNFGTMTKPLHAGQAAHDAVVAVALAGRGFTAHPRQLEAPRGFFALYGDTGPELLDRLPERLEHWLGAWPDDWALKRYPSCFATHRGLDGVLALRDRIGHGEPGGIDPDRIASVEVSVPAASTRPLILTPPTSGLEGKFSLAYTVCRALLTGAPMLADFTDERVADPAVRTLMDRFSLDGRDGPEDRPDGPHTRVTVVLKDGTALREDVDVTYGDASRPLSEDDLAAKFGAALSWAGWPDDEAAALRDRLASAAYDDDLGWLQDALARR